ncbi:MAG: hypothetical protein ABI920_06040 [Casimicrobiaceae bacterium]
MVTLLESVKRSFASWRPADRQLALIPGAAEHKRDPYERRRVQRMLELEAAGKCLARSGKHDNLRYWPADRGSRILCEYRRRRMAAHATGHLA